MKDCVNRAVNIFKNNVMTHAMGVPFVELFVRSSKKSSQIFDSIFFDVSTFDPPPEMCIKNEYLYTVQAGLTNMRYNQRPLGD